MSRRDNAHQRCTRCLMHESLCLCALVPRLETRTRVVLFIHRTELRKPTNTGRLGAHCLVNSEVRMRGSESGPMDTFAAAPGSRPLLLFPYPDAVPLCDVARPGETYTLVVPDGNWRQASKVRNRVRGLRDALAVTLPAEEPSTYRLRHEAHPHGLATIEAIARALGILEGRAVRDALERVFRAMVERTLWSRGAVATDEVTGGIPAGTMRHEPRRPPAS